MPPEFWTPDLRFAPSGVTMEGLPKAAVQYEGIVLQGGIRPYRIGPEGLQILPPRPASRGRNRRPRSAPKARRHPGDVMKCHVLSCDVMFRRRAAPFRGPRRSAAVRILHTVPPSRFRSVRAAAGLPAARPCFARIACARPPAFAPARFARLIARACAREPGAGRTSPVRSVSPDFSPRSWSARCCRAGRVGEPRRAMWGIGQAA